MQLEVNLEAHKVGGQRGRAHSMLPTGDAGHELQLPGPPRELCSTGLGYCDIELQPVHMEKNLMNSVTVFIFKNLENCHSVQQHNIVRKHSDMLMSEQRKIWQILQ